MTAQSGFGSWLAPELGRFVGLKRAGGALYTTPCRILRAFDRYLVAQEVRPPVDRAVLCAYLASLQTLSPRGRDNVTTVIWQALEHARRHGAGVSPLPPRPPMTPRGWRERTPRLLTPAEIRALLASARRLPPASFLRPATTATLLGLLAVTGIRVGEALSLDIGDLEEDEQLLTIRRGKFGKSRLLPLRQSTVAALVRYRSDPRRPTGAGPSMALFVSNRRRRLAYPTLLNAFRQTCRAAEIADPQPRLHDLRHTFAVSTVARAYAEGRDVDRLLPALSTYLGHMSVENTRTYLVANGALLEHAASRFARQARGLDEVLP